MPQSSLVEAPTHVEPRHRLLWVAVPIVAILVGHWMVDTLSAVIPTLLGVVETEYSMRPEWSAMLLGLGSVCSGLAQPIFAWLSDRWNTRVFGSIGILMGALGIGLIGMASNIPLVFLYYAFGMIGIGMFHPIAASTIGRIAGNKRGLALSWFFVFGMAGFFTGSLSGPAIATGTGSLNNLAYLIIPALVIAVVLQIAIGRVEHKAPRKKSQTNHLGQYDWRSLTFLYISCVVRFFVNMAVVYLIVRWMESHFAESNPGWSAKQIADGAAPFIGKANAIMIVGQALGGLTAGTRIRMGNEKISLVLVPLVFAPALCGMAFFPPNIIGYVLIFLTGIGFGSMTPVAISVGQRLMPFHTSLASGIMLGGAWTIAALGPLTAEFLHNRFGLTAALVTTGCMLAFSGVAAMFLNDRSIRLDKHH